MSRLDFRLPDIGEGVTEGEIVEWFVGVGDTIREDDPMVEVMTDKATVTIGAPCDARVEKLCFEVGGVAKVGQVILTLESSAESNVGNAQKSSRPPATAVGEISDELPGAGLFGEGRAQAPFKGNGGTRRSSVRPAIAAQRRALRTSPEVGCRKRLFRSEAFGDSGH